MGLGLRGCRLGFRACQVKSFSSLSAENSGNLQLIASSHKRSGDSDCDKSRIVHGTECQNALGLGFPGPLQKSEGISFSAYGSVGGAIKTHWTKETHETVIPQALNSKPQILNLKPPTLISLDPKPEELERNIAQRVLSTAVRAFLLQNVSNPSYTH